MSLFSRWRLLAAGAVAAVFVVLASASASWACAPQPFVTMRPLGSAPAGSQITVDGFRFPGLAVEIRWNAIEGPLLAKVEGPQFSAPIVVPNVSPGVYSLVLLTRTADGDVGSGTVTTSFEVVPKGAPTGTMSDNQPVSFPNYAAATSHGGTSGWTLVLVGAVMLTIGAAAGALAARGRRSVAATGAGRSPTSPLRESAGAPAEASPATDDALVSLAGPPGEPPVSSNH